MTLKKWEPDAIPNRFLKITFYGKLAVDNGGSKKSFFAGTVVLIHQINPVLKYLIDISLIYADKDMHYHGSQMDFNYFHKLWFISLSIDNS